MDLKRIAFIGRTFEEYMDMFALCKDDLSCGPILDCPAGASSFTAEACAMGYDVTAADILYGEPAETLKENCTEDLSDIFEKEFDKVSDRYTWDYYGSKERVTALRQEALESFTSDLEKGLPRGRYVSAALPKLPFREGAFQLVLSSHFLFIYDNWLSPMTHLSCLRELLRVSSREVRVFPLTRLDGSEYEHMDGIISALSGEGISMEMVPVRFEFLKGADIMLRLFKQDRGGNC